MSRSPSDAGPSERGDVDRYLDAFTTAFRLHEAGRSFSGRERHVAFLNRGDGRFATVSALCGLDLPEDGRGLAPVDWDHDGDLDLWLASRTAPQLRLLRNELPPGRGFLAVRLRGVASNRDAVGARVELHLRRPDGVVVRLLRGRTAGSGYLSQRSAWLHFGLDAGAVIERLVVRWPVGGVETIAGVAAGGRYTVTEGSGRAEPWTPPAAASALAPAPVDAPVRTPPRAYLVSRPPIPPVTARGRDGRPLPLAVPAGEDEPPRLVNLFASWCLPCAGELRELTAAADELAAAGVDVVALTVDGLDPGQATTPDDGYAFLDRLGAPFPAGAADHLLLQRLQTLLDRVFSRRLALAVPTSLLLDGQGRLAAVYRGPVDVATLLADVRNLGATPELRRAMAAPFPGRWLVGPLRLPTTLVAQRFADDGLYEDAAFYLRWALRYEEDTPELRQALRELEARLGDGGAPPGGAPVAAVEE